MFPRDIAKIVADYAAVWTLKDWVPRGTHLGVDNPYIYANPRGHDLTEAGRHEMAALGIKPPFEPLTTAFTPRDQARLCRAENEAIWYTLCTNSNAREIADTLMTDDERARVIIDMQLLELLSRAKSGDQSAFDALWIDPENIDWALISKWTRRIWLLRLNHERIDWYYLSGNPDAADLLKERLDLVHWESLAANPTIFELTVPAGLVAMLTY